MIGASNKFLNASPEVTGVLHAKKTDIDCFARNAPGVECSFMIFPDKYLPSQHGENTKEFI
jgi:hypothetical protein